MMYSPDERKCSSCKRILPLYCFHVPTKNGGEYKVCIVCQRDKYLYKEFEELKTKLESNGFTNFDVKDYIFKNRY